MNRVKACEQDVRRLEDVVKRRRKRGANPDLSFFARNRASERLARAQAKLKAARRRLGEAKLAAVE